MLSGWPACGGVVVIVTYLTIQLLAIYPSQVEAQTNGNTTTFTLSYRAPETASQLDIAPVGLSFEFAWFPSIQGLNNTQACLGLLEDVASVTPHLRIGGTSQDLALYNQSLSIPITTKDNTTGLRQFGPRFLDLAGAYNGSVTIGLNRRLNDINNTIQAAMASVDAIPNLDFIELGNEPDLWQATDPIVRSWPNNSATSEAISEAVWTDALGSALNRGAIIQAGNYAAGPMGRSAQILMNNMNASTLEYVHGFSMHKYPQGAPANLRLQTQHTHIVQFLNNLYQVDAAAAKAASKAYYLGETNSVFRGGDNTSDTFGTALWMLDFALHATTIDVTRLYFHNAWGSSCRYCFWWNSTVSSSFYGAYAATAAFAGARSIVSLDSGSDPYAGYALYNSRHTLQRLVLYNSDYYDGNGTRSAQNFQIQGLQSCAGSRLRVRRLSAASAIARQSDGLSPIFGGHSISDSCSLVESGLRNESVWIGSDGIALVQLQATEAMLIDGCGR